MQVQRVAVAAVPGGQHDGRAVGHEAKVAHQARVEQRVQLGAVAAGPLAVPTQCAALGGGQRGGRERHASSVPHRVASWNRWPGSLGR